MRMDFLRKKKIVGSKSGIRRKEEEMTKEVTEITLANVLEENNLRTAFAAVKRNKGVAGIDNKSIEETAEHLNRHWKQIGGKLQTGHYSPSPVKGILIPKASGGERLLGIPTVQDRFIQQAIQQQISMVFEPLFSEYSFGFRPNRSTHDAIKLAQQYVESGKDWVIDMDIKAFFDNVNHDILMQRVKEEIKDKKLLRLINKYLKAGVVIKGKYKASTKGTPQGSPLSPLLANIYLDKLDKELERRGLSFCRYADDLNIYVGSERSAERVYHSLIKWIEKHLKISINPDKSGTGRPWDRQFLGFRIRENGKLAIDPKRIERYKDKVRQLWNAKQSMTSKELVSQWGNYIRGWINYFKITETPYQITRWTGWTRRHIRKCFWLRWHNKKGRLNALKRLGLFGGYLKTASSSRGAWRIASSPALHRALDNATLKRYGFYVADDFLTSC